MLRHTHEIRVRYGECDAQGHLFNAHYLAFCDIAVTELWRERLGGYEAMVRGGIDMVVAEANVRFRSPARFDDLVAIETTVAELGTTSMTTAYAFTRDGAPLAEARLRHVFVDVAGMAKTPIPQDLRALLEAAP